jgi:FkbM family methyltransferase
MIDIGARDGLPLHWERMGPLIEIIAFEPDDAEARRLEARYRSTGAAVRVRPEAVWDGVGRKTLHLTRSPGCSSLYSPRGEFLAEFPEARRFEITRSVEVDTVPLGRVLAEPGTSPARFVKIDAQGGALRILEGGAGGLQEAVGFELEVEFTPMYNGEPLFGDVDQFLRQRGFELIDLRPTYWRREVARQVAGTRGQLIFADALYLLGPGPFARRVADLESRSAMQLCASALLVCDIYGIPDWSTVYASSLEGVHPEGARLMWAHLERQRRSRWPRLPLGYALGQWLKDIGDALIESRDTWAVAEQRLGNKPRLDLGARLRRRFHRAQERGA